MSDSIQDLIETKKQFADSTSVFTESTNALVRELMQEHAANEISRIMDCLTTSTSNEQWIFSPDLGSSEDGFAWAKYEYEWDHNDDSGEGDGYALQGEGKSKDSLLKYFHFDDPDFHRWVISDTEIEIGESIIWISDGKPAAEDAAGYEALEWKKLGNE